MIDFHEWAKANHSLSGVIGVSDCCLVLADWAIANGHDDVIANYRGTYETEEEMYDVVKGFGGIEETVSFGARLAGLQVIERRCYGCIAVIGSRSNIYRQWGAIWDGVRWNVRLKDGFNTIQAKPLRMWKI